MPKVVLIAIGSRGDVQPMAVLAGALAARGVDARVIALRDYTAMIEQLGGKAVPIESSLAKAVERTGRGWGRLVVERPSGQALILRHWVAEIAEQVSATVDATVGPGDAVLSGVLGRDMATALAQDRQARVATVLFTGMLPTLHPESHYFNHLFGPWPAHNRWGTRFNWQIATGIGHPLARAMRTRLGLPRLGAAAMVRASDAQPSLIAASPLLVPPAPDWPANAHQTGFLAMPRTPFLPDPELVDFLAAGKQAVYVGFGSMSGTIGDQGTAMLIDAARLARRRIITVASNGRPAGLVDDRVLTVDPLPHSWLLPRMAGVVHHGGAGTSQDGLAAGVPSVAVPFGVDQPYHAQRLHALGVGPEPVKVTKLTARSLAELIIELTSGRYTERAAEVGRRLRAEDGVGRTLATLEEIGLIQPQIRPRS